MGKRLEYTKAKDIVSTICMYETVKVDATAYHIPNLRKYLCEIGGKLNQRYTTEVKDNIFFILRTA